MARVFISYRRDDARWPARVLYDAFVSALSPHDVFMDIDTIPLGDSFPAVLKRWVDTCDLLIALIGPDWVGAADRVTGERRLSNPSDFVRIEIGAALKRNIVVVPVLIDGARMPERDDLPDDMKEIVRRQAEFVDYRTSKRDLSKLTTKILGRLNPSRPSTEAFDVHHRGVAGPTKH